MSRLTFPLPSDIRDSGAFHTMSALQVLTPRQARAARAVLRLSVRELAAESGLSVMSIRRIEEGDGAAEKVSLELRIRLQQYFEGQGLEFITLGVRWENAVPEWPMVVG